MPSSARGGKGRGKGTWDLKAGDESESPQKEGGDAVLKRRLARAAAVVQALLDRHVPSPTKPPPQVASHQPQPLAAGHPYQPQPPQQQPPPGQPQRHAGPLVFPSAEQKLAQSAGSQSHRGPRRPHGGYAGTVSTDDTRTRRVAANAVLHSARGTPLRAASPRGAGSVPSTQHQNSPYSIKAKVVLHPGAEAMPASQLSSSAGRSEAGRQQGRTSASQPATLQRAGASSTGAPTLGNTSTTSSLLRDASPLRTVSPGSGASSLVSPRPAHLAQLKPVVGRPPPPTAPLPPPPVEAATRQETVLSPSLHPPHPYPGSSSGRSAGRDIAAQMASKVCAGAVLAPRQVKPPSSARGPGPRGRSSPTSLDAVIPQRPASDDN